jgi:predicted AlkP superfamily pyrophosphatase or phosphodiesterase
MFGPILESIENGKSFDFYIVHVGELDRAGHRFGPHPEAFEGALREIDSWIRRLYESARHTGLKCNLIATSDHGMSDVIGTVDIESDLKQLSLKTPEDYIYFIDSTIARFWFSNETAKILVEKKLASIPNGHVLAEEEKERLNLNFKHNAYGDLFFWLDKGFMFFPNFFQSISPQKTRGMHGYINDSDGVLIIHSDKIDIRQMINKGIIPLVDVFDITRNLAGFGNSHNSKSVNS